jgi:hypothetical protein
MMAMRSPTDQNNVFGALFLVLQLANVKVGIIRWLEHVRTLLLLVLGRSIGIKARGREIGFLQQRRT